MTTITGTAVTGQVITAQTLVNRAQNALSDASEVTWSETLLLEWLNEAIRAYSRLFKRERETTITTTSGLHTYALPTDFHRAISIEYPTGDDPPTYLARAHYTLPAFWQNPYYDILEGDTFDITIGQSPEAGETITIRYQADHDFALTPSSTVTVPQRHHDALVAHVIWSAKKELLAQATQDGDSSSLDLGALADDANDALANWETAVSAIACEQSRSIIINGWKVDEQDRIY